MNKIYKVIWSKARNCYVVVSEIAKRNGKNAATTDKRRKMTTALALSAMAVLLNLGTVAGVEAGVIVHTWDGFGSLIQSGNSHATGGHALAIGQDVGNAAGYRSLVWGQNTNTIDGATNSTAFGENTKTTARNSIAYGLYARSLGAQASAWGENTVAGGIYYRGGESENYDKLGYIDYNFNNNGTIRKAFIYLDGTAPDILNDDAVYNIEKRIETTAKNATAFGQKTVAYGVNSTAFGFKTQATDENATAWGHETKAAAKRATAFGINTAALGRNSTAFGNRTSASGENATAWGSLTQATGGGATAWGTNTQARAETSTAWGNGSIVYAGTWNDSAGNPLYDDVEVLRDTSQPTGKQYYIVGKDSTDNLVTIKSGISSREEADNLIRANGRLAGYNATAFGMGSKTYSENSLAALGGTVGKNESGIGINAAAIGKDSEVLSDNAYAIGNKATIGENSVGSVALGGQEGTQTTIGTGAANSFAAIGGTVGDNATNAIAVGGAVSASATSAIAIGNGANASLENSVALGGSSTTTTGTSVTSATPKTNGITFTSSPTGFAGSLSDSNTSRVVSVGTSGSTRQIQNVAAGAISATSTDAINGSQLYAVANQLQWQIGIGKDTTTTGTNNVALALSPVGKLNAGTDKSNVQIVAGDGIDVSQFTTTDGYGIKVSNHIVKVEHEGSVFKGITTINGTYLTEAEVVDAVNNMITDKRAIYASIIPNDVGGGYKIDLISPFLHINNKAVTDDSGNLSARLFSTATGDSALALGINADAAGKNSIAIGLNADAKGHSEDATTYIEADAATAIGYNAHAHGPGSVAIGAAAATSGNRAIAVGSTARYLDTNMNYTTDNPHQGARAAGQGSIALGDQAKVLHLEYQTDASKIGSPDYKTNDSIAIGTRTQIQAKNAIALGGNTSYTYVDQTTGKSITVYGATDNVFAGNNYGAIVGLGADSGIAIGGAYGTFNSETKKINQVYDAAEVYGLRGIAIGTGAKVADPNEFKRLTDKLNDATYIQKKEAFEEARSNYFAAKKEYESYVTIDPATDSTIPEEMRRNWVTNKQLALEALNRAEATMNEATAAYSLALKKVVRTQMDNSVTDTDAVAIGTQAIASVQDSIALGSKAATDENDQAGTTTGLSGYDPLSTTSDNDYFRGDSKYAEDDPVWRSNAGSLSLGGSYTTTDASGKETITKITRRISNVAAGIDDADVVNVAQLKRSTTITTANRSITIGTDAKGERLVSTPYIHTQGIDDSAQYIALVTEYGDVARYKAGLEKEVSEIQGRIESINTTKYIIETKMKGLDEQLANKEITQAEHDAELAEYNLQLEAIKERLSDLDSSKTAIQKKIDSGEYKTEFETAKTYYDAQATASGKESIAMGHGAKASGQQSVAVGNATSVAGDSSVAIGNSNEVKTANTFVLGNNVTNTVADSVFLGNNTAYVPSGKTTKGIETGYKSADVNGVTFDNFAGGDNVAGVVSVGNEKETRRIQNVAPGLVTKDSTDAVNGSQLYAIAEKVTNTSKLAPTKDGTVNVDPTTGGNNFTTAEQVQNAINNSGWKVKTANGEPQLVKAGDTVDLAAGDGVTITQEVTPDGTKFTFAADVKISDVTDLKNDIANIKTASDEYAVKPKAKVESDNRSATVRKDDASGDYQITSPFININGTELEENQIKGDHWAEATGEKAVAVGQEVTVTGNQSLGVGSGLTVTGNKSGAIGDPSFVHADNSYSIGNNNYVGDGGNNNFAFGNTVNITGGANNVFVLGNEVTVDNKEASNSVILGSQSAYTATATRTGGATGTVNQATVNGVTYGGFAAPTANGVVSVGAEGKERRIQNVAAGLVGPESTDAINGSQLYSAMSNVNNNVTNLGSQITNVDSRARKGIAGAAALAALHPLEFDPDDKLTFAAGVGNYRGETAAAIGAFYRADEKVMFSIGGSMGNGENVVNAGVSFSLDRTPRKTSSRTAMAREIVELREQVAQLTAIVNQLAGGQLPKPPVMFPNTPENAWAYEYLENLQMKGNIVGYTGRELTRNEFAAALDRAMMSGAKLDERLIKEFEPELSHVRVSHVAGKGEDEGGWYERPRTSHDKLENQHEIAKKPLRPQEKTVTSKS